MPAALPVVHFATYAARPEGQPDDILAAAALESLGVRVVRAPWDAPWPLPGEADRARAAVVIRSTWDYFHRVGDFRAWLDALDADGQLTINDTATVRGNLDKRYLRDLSDAGVPVVETAWPEPGDRLADVLAARGWTEAVVKPAISGGAFETFRARVPVSPDDETRFAALAGAGAVLVQPFRHDIVEAGELSLVFLGGAFSHAIVKRPAAGDYRVQVQFGGIYTPIEASEPLVGAARDVLAAASASDLAYARVDGLVRADGGLDLMELEITEPSLFLDHHPDAPMRLARVLAARL